METGADQLLQAVEAYVVSFFDKQISGEYVYHDLTHTRYVLDSAIKISDGYELTEKEREVIQIACWFHDIGYDKGPDGHENRSAEYAVEFLKKYDLPEAELAEITGCIMATQLPQKPNGLLEEIVCDADLSHLGSEWYWDRCGKLRQELSLTRKKIMSEQEWVDFELNFIANHQYHTGVARELFGKRKEKHVQQLLKQKLRLSPSPANDKTDGKKKKKNTPSSEIDLKQINLGRGVETMYRTTYRTHISLSSIADNKANIMLSINAIIISIVISNLVPRFDAMPKLVVPTAILLAVCLTALVFAILSTRPKVTEGRFTREDIENKRANLLFFGNFYKMGIEDFHWGMMELIKDSDFLYTSMTKDLYYLGVVLAKKYRYLAMCYTVFMYGLIIAVVGFALAFILW
ncbi:MAG TPA: DUF5706 domain-containing protein [Flavilitoribacter sp.]|nr:DUF5706 domain-containing protein [Flavilitoribacter sp.]HMQ86937.1 DUF5706 domain-containing protein [Flavilitoribacter sp.]